MTFYAIYCVDSDQGTALRTKLHEEHIAHINTVKERLMLAGPCPCTNGENHEASFLVVAADNIDEANNIIKSDPFYSAGVWQKVTVREFLPVVGAWAPTSAK